MLRSTPILGLALAAALSAQCPRPATPRGGHAVDELPAERVVYSDGVVAEGRLLVPADPAPSCGWPLIVYVHSLGSQREQDAAWQRHLASRGYAVWAYDVRGQAMTRLLNPGVGTTLYGPNERFDLGEEIEHVRTIHAGRVSAERVAVVGDSQGGIHGWLAAVQSGNDLTVAGRGTMHFPTITCVVGADFVTEPIRHRVRGGTLFFSSFIDLCTLDPQTMPFQIDPTFGATVAGFFAAQDPAGLEAWMRADPHREVESSLVNCHVPILFHHAWHDSICGVGPILDAVQMLPPTTPFRLVASTVGHSVPVNDYELGFKRTLAERWFDRFLWDERNGVDEESRFVLAWMPIDAQQHADPSSLWEHDHVAALPSIDAVPRRLYLTDGGRLDVESMATPGTPTRIDHDVPSGFDAAAWLADPGLRGVGSVLQHVPMSERRFETTLVAPIDLIGSPHVHLRVVPDASRFALTALLSVRLPGSQEDRMLTHWGRGVLDAMPGVGMGFDFDLSPIAARIPANATLVLTVRNHWIPESPHLRGLVAAPLFTSYHVDIEHGPGVAASYLELPELQRPAASLVADAHAILVDAPGQVHFRIDAGPLRAGWNHLLMTSLSGQTPGIVLPGDVVPLHLDAATTLFAEAIGMPELLGFAGTLDSAGRADATLDLSGLPALPLELLGQRFSFAAYTYDGFPPRKAAATNPVDVFVR